MSTVSREQFVKDLEYVDDTQGPLNHLSQAAQVVLSHYDHLRAENAAQRTEIEGLQHQLAEARVAFERIEMEALLTADPVAHLSIIYDTARQALTPEPPRGCDAKM